MNRFGLVGAAGYVAPRHMEAVRATGGDLVAAYDPRDSVGILDSYFPDAHFFVEFERFDRHLDKLRRRGEPVDYVSVCSPNYLHDAHVRFGLRSGAHVICEKPLVLNPWNLDGLAQIERETGRRVFSILQLRHHPAIAELKATMDSARAQKTDVDLTYITSRGRWYHTSWKGDVAKSGGIATNIGVHFFDMLIYVFGKPEHVVLHVSDQSRMSGFLECERARVRWFLSIDARDLPTEADGKRTYRSIRLDDREFEFSEGFTDLHTASYRAILAGEGFGIDDVRPSIEVVSTLREMIPRPSASDRHPFAKVGE